MIAFNSILVNGAISKENLRLEADLMSFRLANRTRI